MAGMTNRFRRYKTGTQRGEIRMRLADLRKILDASLFSGGDLGDSGMFSILSRNRKMPVIDAA
jgi:hypothetical protein